VAKVKVQRLVSVSREYLTECALNASRNIFLKAKVSLGREKRVVEYAKANNGVSPAGIELLIRERRKGKTLRQLGPMVGRSHERVRQLLAKHNALEVPLLSENRVIAELGCVPWWLVRLRKEGSVNPIRQGYFWLYSEEQVRQIASLIAERRKCEQCGEPRPLLSRRFCAKCRQDRKKTWYMRLSPERKADHTKKYRALRKAQRELRRKKNG